MTFIASGELVYHIAAVGVVFDLEVFFFDLRLILTISRAFLLCREARAATSTLFRTISHAVLSAMPPTHTLCDVAHVPTRC